MNDALNAASHALYVAWGDGGDEEQAGSDMLARHAAAVVRAYLDAVSIGDIYDALNGAAPTDEIWRVIQAVRPEESP